MWRRLSSVGRGPHRSTSLASSSLVPAVVWRRVATQKAAAQVYSLQTIARSVLFSFSQRQERFLATQSDRADEPSSSPPSHQGKAMYPPNIQFWFNQKSPIELSIQGPDKSREALWIHRERQLEKLTKLHPEWLEKVIREIRTEIKVGRMTEPVRSLCHTLMRWLRAQGFVAQTVEDLLHRLLQEEDAAKRHLVHATLFSIAIDAWTRQSSITRDAPQRAEALLQLMQDRYKEDPKRSCRPESTNVAQVLAAWSNSSLSHAPQRAEQLLEWMEDSSNKFPASTHAYNSVIQAYATHDQAQEAERILRLMEARFLDDPENAVRPNRRSFSTVIRAWALSGQGERGAHKAEALRKQLNDLYQQYPHDDLKPTVSFLTDLMEAWAKSNSPEEGEKVEALWEEIVALRASLSDKEKEFAANRLTEFVYRTRMEAWSKSGKPEKAEAILNEMVDRVAAGDKNAVAPSQVSWNIVAHGWALKGKVDRAEDMLKRMHDDGAQRSVVIYNAILLAWLMSKDPLAADRAQRLLDWMEEQANNGMEELRPNEISYDLVISAWRKSPRKKIAGTNAIGLLDRMEAYLETHPILQKSCVALAYERAQMAVSRSTEEDAHLKATQLLRRIESIHKSGTVGSILTNHNYHIALAACAWAPTRDGEEIAQDIFNRMVASELPEFKPKQRSYEAAIAGWARSFKEDAVARVYALYKSLQERAKEKLVDDPYEPTRRVYNFVLGCCLVSGAPEAEDVAYEVLETMWEKRRSGNEAIFPCVGDFKLLLADAYDDRDNVSAVPLEDLITKIEASAAAGEAVDERFLLDCYTFALTVWGWDRGTEEAVNHSEKLWERMVESSYVSPNQECFIQLMFCYTNQLRDGRASGSEKTLAYKADGLLLRLEKEFSMGVIDWRPDTIGYDLVIETWALSKVDGAPDRAYQLLERMDAIFKKFGSDHVKPTAATYGLVLLACALNPSKDNETKLHHFNVAIRAFKHLQASEYCEPDRSLYNRLLMCAIYLAPDRESRVKMTRHVFSLACQSGLVDKRIFKHFWGVAPKKERRQLLGRHDDDVSYSELPSEWTSNAKDVSQ